jgi:nitroreductase
MNLIEALHWRYAVRKFSSQRIDERKVRELLNATRLSAASYGLQPYRLILVEDIEVRRKLLGWFFSEKGVCTSYTPFAIQC